MIQQTLNVTRHVQILSLSLGIRDLLAPLAHAGSTRAYITFIISSRDLSIVSLGSSPHSLGQRYLELPSTVCPYPHDGITDTFWIVSLDNISRSHLRVRCSPLYSGSPISSPLQQPISENLRCGWGCTKCTHLPCE